LLGEKEIQVGTRWNVMMYPYMILADETEIVHSQIIEKDGMKKNYS